MSARRLAARGARAAALVLLIHATVGAGCPLGSTDTGPSIYESALFPTVAYTGHNPNATFRVLFATSAPSPQWAVTDPSIATVAPSGPPAGATDPQLSYALVTTTKAGETNVTVTGGGITLTSRLVVKDYSDATLAAGKARYDAGTANDPARVSCASCHAKPDGVDHSPLKLAGFDDATILGVIQDATYPPSPSGRAVASDYAPKGPLSFTGHKWNLTEPEKDGILAHLRSLPLGHL